MTARKDPEFRGDERFCIAGAVQERFGKTLPWPLNYIIPYTQAMSVRRQFKGIDAHEVCTLMLPE